MNLGARELRHGSSSEEGSSTSNVSETPIFVRGLLIQDQVWRVGDNLELSSGLPRDDSSRFARLQSDGNGELSYYTELVSAHLAIFRK